jgi:hypothetical protein
MTTKDDADDNEIRPMTYRAVAATKAATDARVKANEGKGFACVNCADTGMVPAPEPYGSMGAKWPCRDCPDVPVILVTASGGVHRHVSCQPGMQEVNIKDVGVAVRVFRRVPGSRARRPVFLEAGGPAEVRVVVADLPFAHPSHRDGASAAARDQLDRRYGSRYLDEWDEDGERAGTELKVVRVRRAVLLKAVPFEETR